jgi:O-antigen/teichoic acid export membrane protein
VRGDHSTAPRWRFSHLAATPLRGGLAWGTVGTIGLNLATTLVNFILALVLARVLGTSGYGAYAFAFAWAAVLAVPATLGLAALVVRNTAAYSARHEWGLLRGFLRRSNQLAAASSVVVVLIAGALGWILLRGDQTLLEPYLIGLFLVPIVALTTVRQSALQGLGRVVLGRVPETLIAPGLFLALVAATHLAIGSAMSASWAMTLNVGASCVALGTGALILRRSLPVSVREARRVYEMRVWAPSALRLLVASALMALTSQLGTILLGLLGGPSDAGIFNVAQRAAAFVSFLALATSYPLMPLVAQLHAKQEGAETQRVLTRAARVVLLCSVPVAAILIIFAGPVMRLFGPGFGAGAEAMQILVIGELAGVLAGFGGLVLVMTGNERHLGWAVAIRAGTALPLMLVLIPPWGVVGAAVGSAAGAIVSNLFISWAVWRRLGLYAPAIRFGLRQARQK